MKKSIIAAGAASMALAAMPIVGAFAENVQVHNSITDKVLLEVTKSCEMYADEDATGWGTTIGTSVGTTVDLGQISAGTAAAAKAGTEMTITCNSTAGWTLSAQAADMVTNVSGGPNYTIPFGQYAGSTQATSVWSAQFALTGQGTGGTGDPVRAQLATGAGAYATTPVTTAASNVIAQNTSDSSVTPAKPYGVSGLKVTPSYIAYAAADQEAGSYTGSITYTFADLTTP